MLILAVVVTCICAVAGGKRGVLFTTPKVLVEGTTEKVCGSLHGFEGKDVHVQISLLEDSPVNKDPLATVQAVFSNGEGACVKLRVPNIASKSIVNVKLKVSAWTSNKKDYWFNESKTVKLAPKNLVTFIQTDKPIYKPGQTVKFRILTLKSDLRFRDGKFGPVYIQDPHGVRMAQWLQVTSNKGIVSLEMNLSEDPVLGEWKITVEVDGRKESDKFKVSEYVLPKYEVSITPPPYVMVDASEIPIEICAKYTYGKPVQGMLTGNVTINVRRVFSYGVAQKRPGYKLPKQKLNGCVTVKVPSAELMLSSSKYSVYNAFLSVNAQVKEDGTGVVLNGTNDKTAIERRLLKLSIEESAKTFKPGLQYYGKGKVTYPDDTPAASQRVSVVAQHYSSGYKVTKEVVSNSQGEFYFDLPPMQKNIKSFNLRVEHTGKTRKHGPSYHVTYVDNKQKTVKQWYSPSGSFVQITPVLEEQACDQTLQLKITYTSPKNTNYKFYYQVLSRGDFVQHGHKHHHFKGHTHAESSRNGSGWQMADQQDRCVMPKMVGPCRASLRSWYYDTASKKCEKFNYGGCRGNRNRFSSLDDCTAACAGRSPEPVERAGNEMQLVYFHLPVAVTPEVAPKMTILVYHVLPSGETVADSTTITVQQCFRNKVSMKFAHEQRLPGDFTSLNVSAEPGSLCAVGVVDKSIQLLGGNSMLTSSRVFDAVKQFDINEDTSNSDDEYCRKQLKDDDDDDDDDVIDPQPPFPPAQNVSPPAPPAPPSPEPVGRRGRSGRRERSIWPGFFSYYSEYYDSSEAFADVGLLSMTDMTLEMRPCEKRRDHYVLYSPMTDDMQFNIRGGGQRGRKQSRPGAPGGRQPQSVPQPGSGSPIAKPAVDVRTYFPETWLWELNEVGDNGHISIPKEVPHTVTEWVGNAFCTHKDAGLGISDAARIRGFQPFFVSFTLPYSVIRGEKVPVKITAFNYLPKECLVVKLALRKSQDFELLTGSRSHKLCVCGNEAKTHTFHIRPLNLGHINITVKAVTMSDSKACSNGAMMSNDTGARDAVVRQLLVEPEGKEEEYTIGHFMCPDDQKDIVEGIKLNLPKDLVPYSEQARLTVIGDVMGPSLAGLESLLRLPTGCGEQNMLKFSPNIFVMDYLTSTNQLTDDVREKALGFLKTGYQRELNYRHDDGSYSAFGKRDKEGSTWLTAFVTKSFAQARRFIYIDPEDLRKSLMWFRFKQLENGCFRTIGTVHHKSMKGGLSSGGRSLAPLTAYVLTAMLEAGIPPEDEAITNCLRCLSAQTIDDPYTTALVAYAYSMLDPGTTRWANIMEKLEGMAIKKDGLLHWERPQSDSPTPDPNDWAFHVRNAPSAEVEMTAYALLSYVIGDPQNAVNKGLPIVKWLSAQRNAYGGFSSTQDTVMALQALASYAQLAFKAENKVKVMASGTNLNKVFYVDTNNRLLLQRTPLSLPSQLTVRATGTGCAFVQAHVKYNVPDMNTKKPAFQLRVSVNPAPTDTNYLVKGCMVRSLSICARFTANAGKRQEQSSNMALIDVRMVSGWLPMKDSIRELMQDTTLNLKKYEVDKNYVHFYFDQLTSSYTCLQFLVEQDIEVHDTKPALIKVYDYYETDLMVTKPYRIKTTCGTKEELPHLKPGAQPSPVEQSRLPVESPFTQVQPQQPEDICPTCLTSAPADLMARYCQAQHAYKALILPPGRRFKFKIQKDLRVDRKKARVNKSVKPLLNKVCQCPALSKGGRVRALILTKETKVEDIKQGKNKATLELNAQSTIILLDKRASKGLKSLKAKRCN